MSKKLILNKLLEISGVDAPAHEGATVAIAKARSEFIERFTKDLEEKGFDVKPLEKNIIRLSYIMPYFYDGEDVVRAANLFNDVMIDLQIIKVILQTKAVQFNVEDDMPTEGFFADLGTEAVVKQYQTRESIGKGKDTPMSNKPTKTAEELQKELDAANAKIAEMEKSGTKESSPDASSQGLAEVRKELAEMKADQADAELTKRAKAFPNIRGGVEVVKRMLKSIDAIEDEKERETALNELKLANDSLNKFFSPVGDAGAPDAISKQAETEEAYRKFRDAGDDPSVAFAKANPNWKPPSINQAV